MKYIIFNLISLFIYNFICKIFNLIFYKRNKNNLNKILSNNVINLPFDLGEIIPNIKDYDGEYWDNED